MNAFKYLDVSLGMINFAFPEKFYTTIYRDDEVIGDLHTVAYGIFFLPGTYLGTSKPPK